MHRSRKVVNVAKFDASKSAVCCIDFPIGMLVIPGGFRTQNNVYFRIFDEHSSLCSNDIVYGRSQTRIEQVN